jgi:hypothetical protein
MNSLRAVQQQKQRRASGPSLFLIFRSAVSTRKHRQRRFAKIVSLKMRRENVIFLLFFLLSFCSNIPKEKKGFFSPFLEQ